jgi:hypothetical protein
MAIGKTQKQEKVTEKDDEIRITRWATEQEWENACYSFDKTTRRKRWR